MFLLMARCVQVPVNGQVCIQVLFNEVRFLASLNEKVEFYYYREDLFFLSQSFISRFMKLYYFGGSGVDGGDS